jgi:predicted aspartyl protease
MYKLEGKAVKFKIDTGSQVNILPFSIYKKLRNVRLTKTKTNITSYSGDDIKLTGKCQIKLQNKKLEFYFADTDQSPLLGFKASQDLGLVQVVMTVYLEDPI